MNTIIITLSLNGKKPLQAIMTKVDGEWWSSIGWIARRRTAHGGRAYVGQMERMITEAVRSQGNPAQKSWQLHLRTEGKGVAMTVEGDLVAVKVLARDLLADLLST